jgi:hypothetical protein
MKIGSRIFLKIFKPGRGKTFYPGQVLKILGILGYWSKLGLRVRCRRGATFQEMAFLPKP